MSFDFAKASDTFCAQAMPSKQVLSVKEKAAIKKAQKQLTGLEPKPRGPRRPRTRVNAIPEVSLPASQVKIVLMDDEGSEMPIDTMSPFRPKVIQPLMKASSSELAPGRRLYAKKIASTPSSPTPSQSPPSPIHPRREVPQIKITPVPCASHKAQKRRREEMEDPIYRDEFYTISPSLMNALVLGDKAKLANYKSETNIW